MIYRLLSRFYHFAQAEYWRGRCLNAEAQLEAEKWRNIYREDSLVNVPMRSMGMWPISPRVGPAQPPNMSVSPRRPLDPIAAFNDLGAVDRMEFETNWLPDAEAHNIPLDQAKQKFLAELAKRKTLNDDPYSM